MSRRRRKPRTALERALRNVDHVVFDESREGRAAEIAAWANGVSALVVGAGVAALTWSALPVHAAWIGLTCGVLTFALLRLALTHKSSVWLGAAIGTLTVAALGGALAWLFAHVIERPWAPSFAAVLGALVAALPPAWSYAQLARRRANDVPDSLLDPVTWPPPSR